MEQHIENDSHRQKLPKGDVVGEKPEVPSEEVRMPAIMKIRIPLRSGKLMVRSMFSPQGRKSKAGIAEGADPPEHDVDEGTSGCDDTVHAIVCGDEQAGVQMRQHEKVEHRHRHIRTFPGMGAEESPRQHSSPRHDEQKGGGQSDSVRMALQEFHTAKVRILDIFRLSRYLGSHHAQVSP